MYTVGHFIGFDHLVQDGYILRIPFLFVVALFFGHLVENTQTAEKDAAEARQREKMKTEFLSSVTHDLKNPLGLIEGMAASLLAGERGSMPEPQADLVRRIHANTHRVIALSLNLLDAARVEAGMLTLQRTPARLGDVVEDAISLARSAADSKGVALSMRAEPGLPEIDIDFMQMGRVISNLLDNAIKYTPAGTAVVVDLTRSDERMVMSVGDNGSGIPPNELSGIFDQYRRHAGSNRIHGSGLGLFIVKHLVEAHGGTVGATSTVGQGTTITVELPLTAAAEPRTPWRRPQPSAPPPVAADQVAL
jgi:signal transduction histidine kinase